MEAAALMVIFILIVLIGYIIMKKLDGFQEELRGLEQQEPAEKVQPETDYKELQAKKSAGHLLNGADVIKSIGMIVLASALGFGFWKMGMSEANIIMVYILGVLFTSVITTHRIYSIVASIVSVFVFNFLFTEISNEGLKMFVAGERRLLLIFI